MRCDKRLVVLALVLASMLVLVGCGSEAATDTAEETQASAGDVAALPEVDAVASKTGWALMQEKCTVCHPIATVNEARLSWEEWKTAVGHMLDNGATLTDAEQQAVLEYLRTRDEVFATGPSVFQQECMVCHTTQRVNEAAYDWTGWETAVDHMIANGAQIDQARRAVIVEYLAIRGPQ
ncbi:MAG: hypothetical protein JXA36_00510 [Coriobacteriia bacterium]|nr:hypothetical protein [Coriobacteriia bacterium]